MVWFMVLTACSWGWVPCVGSSVRARFSGSCGSCGLRVVGTELVYDCVRPHVGWGFCMGRVVGAVPVFASVRFWPVVFGVWPGVMVRALARKTY